MFNAKLDETLIQSVLEKAQNSPRRRANHCFHLPTDRLQRMLNVGLSGTYFRPHQHKNPDKLEIFTLLRGKVKVILFKDDGEILETCTLSHEREGNAHSPCCQVEIPAGTWHTLIILSPEAILYEVIDGYFDAATHKRFAPWAPAESDEIKAQAYLSELNKRSEAFSRAG